MRLADIARGLLRFGPPQPTPRKATFASVSLSSAHWPGTSSGSVATAIGRDEAMQVTAVQRGRNIICGVIGSLPLACIDTSNFTVDRGLFRQIDPNVANVVTMTQTVEDLLCESVAWWEILSFGADGFPYSARRVEPWSVTLNPPIDQMRHIVPSGLSPDGVVWIDGRAVPKSSVIRFDSPNRPLLKDAARAIRTVLKIDQTLEMYSEEPQATGYFTPEDATVDPFENNDEVEEFLESVAEARRDHAIAYVPAGLKWMPNQYSPAELQLSERQGKANLAIANALGIDPEDLGISTTSRTYQNSVDRRQDMINNTLAGYMRAITDRLSMPDVTPRTMRAAFDLDDFLKADAATRWATYQTAKDLGVISSEQIAHAEGIPYMPDVAALAGAAPPTVAVTATRTMGATFTAPPRQHITFDRPAGDTTFTVDEMGRTITGMVVPYGKVAWAHGEQWRFQPGSLKFTDISRVKLLIDHTYSAAVGHAISIQETATGLMATFKIARGAEGDRALALASDKVLDGLSVGCEFRPDGYTKAADGVNDVFSSAWRETSLTAQPAFDDARVTSIAASAAMEGKPAMTLEEIKALIAQALADMKAEDAASAADAASSQPLAVAASAVPVQVGAPPQERAVVDPAARPIAFVAEPVAYRFNRAGRFDLGDHDFATDVVAALKCGDFEGRNTDAGKRAFQFIRSGMGTMMFSTIVSTDVNELNPTVNRPEMYVDGKVYKTPCWDAFNKGALPNGLQPFTFPKFSSASGLVAAHSEGTEPTSGTFVTTSQTITPGALSGKVSISRETWDMGGNPATSQLIWDRMKKAYVAALEAQVVTFLGTLTAATDITLTTAATDEVLSAAWDAALAGLQFVEDYDFSTLLLEQVLYKAFVAARDTAGRVLYPIIGAQNANGSAASRFRTLDLGGVTGIPAPSLASTPGSSNVSYLADPSTVYAWAAPPQRLELQGTTGAAANAVLPAGVAMIDLGLWGYSAFANTDIGGVREVKYDSVS